MAKVEQGGVQLGPVGETARKNLTRIRRSAGFSQEDLERRMTGERQLTLSALSKIETGGRRIDVDDLVAIAAALDVSPLAILFDTRVDAEEIVEAGGSSTMAHALWSWAAGEAPLHDHDQRAFQVRSLPWWLQVSTGAPHLGLPPSSREQIERLHSNPEASDDGEHPEAP